MGFEEDTDALFLPMSAPIEVVQAFKTAIERLTPPSDATSATEGKVHIFWEGHKILRNLHQLFVLSTTSQIIGGDFAKFGGLLRIYEL